MSRVGRQVRWDVEASLIGLSIIPFLQALQVKTFAFRKPLHVAPSSEQESPTYSLQCSIMKHMRSELSDKSAVELKTEKVKIKIGIKSQAS